MCATHAMRDLSLPKPPEGAIMPHNYRESGECQFSATIDREEAHESAAIQGPT
jgi:hypothetical protein